MTLLVHDGLSAISFAVDGAHSAVIIDGVRESVPAELANLGDQLVKSGSFRLPRVKLRPPLPDDLSKAANDLTSIVGRLLPGTELHLSAGTAGLVRRPLMQTIENLTDASRHRLIGPDGTETLDFIEYGVLWALTHDPQMLGHERRHELFGWRIQPEDIGKIANRLAEKIETHGLSAMVPLLDNLLHKHSSQIAKPVVPVGPSSFSLDALSIRDAHGVMQLVHDLGDGQKLFVPISPAAATLFQKFLDKQSEVLTPSEKDDTQRRSSGLITEINSALTAVRHAATVYGVDVGSGRRSYFSRLALMPRVEAKETHCNPMLRTVQVDDRPPEVFKPEQWLLLTETLKNGKLPHETDWQRIFGFTFSRHRFDELIRATAAKLQASGYFGLHPNDAAFFATSGTRVRDRGAKPNGDAAADRAPVDQSFRGPEALRGFRDRLINIGGLDESHVDRVLGLVAQALITSGEAALTGPAAIIGCVKTAFGPDSLESATVESAVQMAYSKASVEKPEQHFGP